jgi:hypothetical protein
MRLLPVSSNLLSFTNNSEEREYNITIIYYFDEKFVKTKAVEHIFRFVSRTESIIHDNQTMTLSDSSRALNCRVEETSLDNEPEEDKYIVELEFVCQHVGNIN